MKFLKIFFLVPVFLSLYACAMVDSAGTGVASREEVGAPRVYYSGVSGLKMFPKPKVSGSPIAELPLHAKVLRYKIERGFAHVKVSKTGQVGWVRNRHLIWRIPTPGKVTAGKPLPPPRKKTDTAPEAKSHVNPEPNSETQRRDASMFDAF